MNRLTDSITVDRTPGEGMNNRLVSAIVPTYERPQRLRRAVNSVIAQTYEPIELIVIDDHSTTPMCDAIDDLPTDELESFRCFRKSQNEGGSAARNTGIEAANGRYIAFLDDDDEWRPGKIEAQVEVLENQPEYGAVYVGIQDVDERGRTISVKTRTTEGEITKRLLRGNFIGSFSVIMVRREVIDRIGLLDERFPSWQDWEFYLRVSVDYKFKAIPQPFVIRHNKVVDQISQNYERKREVSYPLFMDKFGDLISNYGKYYECYVCANHQFRLGKSAIRVENYPAAKRHFANAIRLYPFDTSYYVYLASVLGNDLTYKPIRNFKRRLVRTYNNLE